jgi:hypothetical protein
VVSFTPLPLYPLERASGTHGKVRFCSTDFNVMNLYDCVTPYLYFQVSVLVIVCHLISWCYSGTNKQHIEKGQMPRMGITCTKKLISMRHCFRKGKNLSESLLNFLGRGRCYMYSPPLLIFMRRERVPCTTCLF